MAIRIGYKLMSELYGPKDLVDNARRAEAAGFDFVSISDHFHPWMASQGHSPYAWSVLGAIAASTTRVELTTAVTCPYVRYHPAIIAQAAATIACMSDGRFSLGLGTGENLNEHVVGETLPPPGTRREMLRESIEAMRGLWSGGVRSYAGRHVRIDRARIFDLPDAPPKILVAAAGPSGAKLAAEQGDGLFATEPKPSIVDAWRESAGKGPAYAEVALSWGRSVDEAQRVAHERFRFGVLGWKLLSELPSFPNFEAATQFIRPEDIARSIACGPDPAVHLAAIRKYREAGFDHLVLVGVGEDQSGFIDFCRRELHPALRT
jgi:G6PDH family F420-dependent oxidoreductase